MIDKGNAALNLPGFSDVSAVRFFSLGRFALAEGLRALSLAPGAYILVPAFICRDLLAAIHAVGAVPVFLEVDERLEPSASSALWPTCAAVLAVNYFGFPQNLEPFRAYCKRTRAILIEDNAHGFLSADTSGALLGSRGDLGLLSMRKTFFLPNGAALLVNRASMVEKLPDQLPFSDQALPVSFNLKRLLSRIQRYLRVPVLAWMQSLVRLIRYWRTGHAITPLAEENEFVLPKDPRPHPYVMKALASIDAAAETERRKNLYQKFQLQLANYPIQTVFPSLPENTVPYGFPFYASDADAAFVVKVARSSGLDCVRWPDLPKAVAPTAPAHYQSLWMINFLC
ncbi:DegT/DnrJ/EryC1/StrS family aminotransferase [Rhodoferax saidenbachensis]|uniref:DegT/DnrJ/EryC1/StrS aminotransferase n=1 Tax=Rhodoferax saidenbachensis TaxID=1484693 RepID=A0A1P8KDU9_9BURK|nr:DegT/DnrJ/EryC1/StrS family aminotransferase [Rhodoferax saidenbachensis]APW44169.1 hypothetical protein RS694_17640 [Rhodoferax saidenbachensis]